MLCPGLMGQLCLDNDVSVWEKTCFTWVSSFCSLSTSHTSCWWNRVSMGLGYVGNGFR